MKSDELHDGLIVAIDDAESAVSDGSSLMAIGVVAESSTVPDGVFLFLFHFIRRF